MSNIPPFCEEGFELLSVEMQKKLIADYSAKVISEAFITIFGDEK